MPLLRSRPLFLSETPQKTLVPSSQPFTPPIIDSPPNTAGVTTAGGGAASAISSRRRLSLRLANKFSSDVVVAADERNREDSVSGAGRASDFGEGLRLQLRSGSGMLRGMRRNGSDRGEKDEEMEVSYNDGGLGNVNRIGGNNKCKNSLKRFSSSPERFTPSTSASSSPDDCVISQRLACKVTLPVIVAANEGAGKRMNSSKISCGRFGACLENVEEEVEMVIRDTGKVEILGGKNEEVSNAMESSFLNRADNVSCAGRASDFGELRSGSGMLRGRRRSRSDRGEKDEEFKVSYNDGGSGNVNTIGGNNKCKNSLKRFSSSPVRFTPSTSASSSPDYCVISQRLACEVTSPVIGKRTRSKISYGRFGDCLENVEEEVEMVMSDAGKIGILAGENEQVFNAMESASLNEYRSIEGVVQDAGCQMDLSTQNESGYMSLRSGSRVPKRKIGDDGIGSLLIHGNLDEFSDKKVKLMKGLSPQSDCFEKPVHTNFIKVEEIVEEQHDEGSFVKESKLLDESVAVDDRGVGKLFLDGDESLEHESAVCSRQGTDFDVPIPEGVHEGILIDDGVICQRRSKTYSQKEKGKGKLTTKDFEVIAGEQSTKHEVEFSNTNGLREQNNGGSQGNVLSRREAARNIAVELAPQFAFFKAEEEEEDEEVEVDDPILDTKEDEDWPGPFSTAMKIIEERETVLQTRSLHFSSQNEKMEVQISWTPSGEKHAPFGNLAPSLKDMCLKVLCDNAEEVESLEGLPDAIKHKIAMMLCHSRRMSFGVLCLLTKGSPTEIFLSDCSWATEKQFEEAFSRCNIVNLKVLQLDFCGRCLPDYVLRSTLAKGSNCLPSLIRLSLKGAYCLSDSGLDAIVTSAPLLKSLNLSQCSLITSTGIISVAEKLGSVLQELFIDVCQNVDAMLILPALKKLQHLEVLSVAHLETVTDRFLKNFIPFSGQKMRGLIVAGCRKLTNSALKTIGECCPRLSSLDIRHLNRLNDSAIEHLANGGCPFQTLKICHGAFSDEALAAFLETSGATLVELVLNNIEKAAGNTALAISRRCSPSLRILDLSFCRKMTDEALGLIVDSCPNLRVLKLFGCTQVTDLFLQGHSNSLVRIIGLSGSILDEIEVPDFS